MSKVNQLYNMIQGGYGSPLSCTVVYSGVKGNEIFSGFLQEDPKVANRSTYNNSTPGVAGPVDKIFNVVSKGAETVGGLMTNVDGGGQMLNPLQMRNIWQGNEYNSFDVTVTLYTLNEDTNVIQKAQKALELTSPSYGNNTKILEAPGGYKYSLFDATSDARSHAENTWAIRMGNHFSADNLACIGVNVTVSKETVRLGDPKDYNNMQQPTAPLYVQLAFSFVTDRLRYSDEVVNFITQRQPDLKVLGDPSQASRSLANRITGFGNTVQEVKDAAWNGVTAFFNKGNSNNGNV